MNYLLVIDMQNDFVDGTLGTAEATAIVPRVAEKIRAACAAGEPVFTTMDTHDDGTYLTTQEGTLLPVKHCIRGTHGWELHPEIQRACEASVQCFVKPTFGSEALVEALRRMIRPNDTITLVGLCTDICVVSNALLLKAALPECRITVDAACCAGVTPESHAAALTVMRMCQILVENAG